MPPRILSKLSVYTPPNDLVDAYLGEIARGYGVSYVPVGRDLPPLEDELSGGEGGGEGSGSGSGGEGVKNAEGKKEGLKVETAGERTPSPAADKSKDEKEKEKSAAGVPRGQTVVVKKPTAEDELAARFERLKSLR